MNVATRGPAISRLRPVASMPGMSRLHAIWSVIPLLIVSEHERKRLAGYDALGEQLVFYDRADALRQRLESEFVRAVVIEPHDCDGVSVATAILGWVERRPLVPVIVWTTVHDAAIREVLELAFAGADVRLVLRGRDELALVVERLFERAFLPHRGAVPAILRHIVQNAPRIIQPDLTVGAYHAWPRPSVDTWAESLQITRQALNTRLACSGFAPAGAVLDCFNAAEIAIRCTHGMKLKQIAMAMGRLDDRALRRRLERLRCCPEDLRSERDFAGILPRMAEALRRVSMSPECGALA